MGLFGYDAIALLFGSIPQVQKAIYATIGVAAILEIFAFMGYQPYLPLFDTPATKKTKKKRSKK